MPAKNVKSDSRNAPQTLAEGMAVVVRFQPGSTYDLATVPSKQGKWLNGKIMLVTPKGLIIALEPKSCVFNQVAWLSEQPQFWVVRKIEVKGSRYNAKPKVE